MSMEKEFPAGSAVAVELVERIGGWVARICSANGKTYEVNLRVSREIAEGDASFYAPGIAPFRMHFGMILGKSLQRRLKITQVLLAIFCLKKKRRPAKLEEA